MGAAVVIIGLIALYLAQGVRRGAASGLLEHGSLSSFEPKVGPIVHSFRGAPAEVHQALMHGVAQAPGATLVECDEDTLLVSTRPTPMHGGHGLFVRMRLFSLDDEITTVVVEAQPKLGVVSATRATASLVQFDNDARMALRRRALVEELV